MESADRPTAEDRALFNESLEGFLGEAWPVETAVAWGGQPAKIANVTTALARQGVTALGCDPAIGGVAEMLVSLRVLGRGACRAPVLAPILLNLVAQKRPALQHGIAALQDAWCEGNISLAYALAAQDSDHTAGVVQLEEGLLTGQLRFVENAASVSHLAVAVSADSLAFVAMSDAGVTLRESVLMDLPGACDVTLHRAPVTVVAADPELLRDLLALARLGHAARALGAAERAFELVLAYTKEREQFGKFIGSFQAIQHKLANNHIALAAVHRSLEHAALKADAGDASWHWYAAAATGLANNSLRRVSLETQHAFGAIGYSEEHEAPRHFRGVHLDVLRHGGAPVAHEELAAYFLDEGQNFPAHDLGDDGNAFRLEVRAWLDSVWSGVRKDQHEALPFHAREYAPDFAAQLGTTGWIGLSWPARFGGQGRSTLEQLAFIEEMEAADAPRTGAPVQAVMLQVFGTEAQQRRFLPEILSGEAMFGMGYSEPQAGSDLAALKTKAVRDGDHYVINGQKIWTTTYWGKYMLLAARTHSEPKSPTAGISLFIVPLSTPGITVRTSSTLYGGTFANIFYDDVRVPADSLVGREGEGWKVLTGALATERGLVGGGIVLRLVHLFNLLCGHLRRTHGAKGPLAQDPVVRARVGELAGRIEAGRQLMLHCARALDQGNMDIADAAVSKVWSSELMESFAESALDMLGMEGVISQGSDGAVLNGCLEQNLRHSLMWVISIGTNEIQRNLIARRALGLPR